MAEKADQIRAREAAQDAERQRRWVLTRQALDELAPEVAAECAKRRLPTTSVGALKLHRAWVFAVAVDGEPDEATVCMHLAFHRDASWTLLGYHDGECTTPVDKNATFHPGLRQGFVFDRYRHEAEVVVTLPREELRRRILDQIADRRKA